VSRGVLDEEAQASQRQSRSGEALKFPNIDSLTIRESGEKQKETKNKPRIGRKAKKNKNLKPRRKLHYEKEIHFTIGTCPP
jgi:hypothetical protein